MRNCIFEDIHYEHCSYFSPGSLASLFRKCSFDLLNLQTEYENQYLTIEVSPAKGKNSFTFSQEKDLEKLKEYVSSFKKAYDQKMNLWEGKLNEFKNKRHHVVLWGSSSKAVAFLTNLKIYDGIDYVVDISPYRQGSFMPSTGQKIVPPEFLQTYKPDIVIIMNPIYQKEITQNLSQMGLNPDILIL